tara:strand:+ start:5655 stop:7271 length:1617 start_codon:yes stop_codon:yes gene_type:complete
MRTYYRNWRLILIFLFLFISITAIFSRMVYIQLQEGIFLLQAGSNQNTKVRTIEFKRGSIFDKNGIPLAISITGFDLFALSGLSEDEFLRIQNTLNLRDIKYETFSKKTLIKQSLSFDEMRKIRSLQIDRLELEKTYKRHYPLGEQVAPLVGFSGRDGYGLEGLEKSYNSFLTGKPLKERILKDGARSTIQRLEILEFGEKSRDLTLTIDSNIQYIAYKYLVEAIKNNDGSAGTVIVLDNTSREVLALASYPSYNPNNPMRSIKKNRAFLESYEPGSIVKPLALAGAIENNLIEIDTEMELPIKIEIGRNIINDRKEYGKLKAFEIIKESSQVGATQISFLLGADRLIENYKNFGFTKPISINFPSSSFGEINSRDDISDIEIATLGYGYGLTATPFQISQAYAIFANKGIFYDFRIVKDNTHSIFQDQIISQTTAEDILFAMKEVVDHGTGALAKLEQFNVSGKTGTTEKLRDGSYKSSSYTASFVGIGPNPSNQLTIFVNIDGLGSQKYSGGSVAAPLFKRISNDVFAYMGYFSKN